MVLTIGILLCFRIMMRHNCLPLNTYNTYINVFVILKTEIEITVIKQIKQDFQYHY